MEPLTASPARRSAWTDDAFSRFWHQLGGIFGRPWYEQNGPEPNEVWTASIAEMSFEKAAAVLWHFRASGDHFPPNLSQVMKIAREIKTHAPAAPSPEGKRPSPNVVAQAIAEARKAKKQIRRSVLRPDESFADYQEALAKSGMPKSEFDAQRLIENGWTPKDEALLRHHCHVVGFILP